MKILARVILFSVFFIVLLPVLAVSYAETGRTDWYGLVLSIWMAVVAVWAVEHLRPSPDNQTIPENG